jgi:hypothetical protein
VATLVAACALAGVTAPVASADSWFLDTTADPVRPDDRATRPGVVAPAVRPDDEAGVRGPGAAPAVAPVIATTDEFDWTDAGIGAAAALGVLALGAGALLGVRSRHPSRASVH